MGDELRKRRWPKRVVTALLVILVPLVVGYFVATSEGFFKGVILPRVGKALNAKVTVEQASIKPFSEVILRGVKVHTTGSAPLVAVKEARVRHSLTDIVRGNIKVGEVAVISPFIQIVENEDGTSNLDPILKQQAQKPQGPSGKPPETKPSSPPKVDIGQIKIENGTLRKTRGTQITEVSNFNLTIANVKNGENGTLDISGRLLGELEGGLDGKIKFALTPDLQPGNISGNADLNVTKAAAGMSELSGMNANFVCEVTPAEVKQLALTFQKQQQPLGQLRAYGPFSAAKQEGRLNVELLGIDRRLLAMVGARLGMDFKDTKINSTNVIELSKGGNEIAASGALAVTSFSVTQSNRSTPTVNIDFGYGASVNRKTDAAVLQKLQLTGTQNQKALITASLAQPMSIALGQTNGALPDSALNAKITGFSFRDWTAVLGDDVPEGNLNADMEVQSRESGKLLALKGSAELTGLMLNDPEKRKLIKPLEAKVRIDGAIREKVLELAQLTVALTPTQLAKNDANLKGRIDLTRSEAITGKLELQSDALDLNGYYDLLKGDEKKKPAEKPASKPGTSAPPVATPQSSGKKKDLPFKNFVVDTRIGQVYLRELNLTNVVAGMRVDGSRADLKPIALVMNGSPINGAVSVDLGADDLGYDVTLKMDRVPLAPIANSFAEEYRNRAKGEVNGNIQIKGVGTTGTTLKKTLQGQITASCTNGQIQLAGQKLRGIIDDVAKYFGLPELRTAPLTAFDAQIVMGDGKIQIKSLDLVSDAFTAHTAGAITIADQITNSVIPRIPVTFALSRSLAERISMAGNAPPEAQYVSLPQFLAVTGTVGKPKADLNEAAIAGIAARRLLPKPAGQALDAVDALLGRQKGANTNAPSTNKTANPLDSLKKVIPK